MRKLLFSLILAPLLWAWPAQAQVARVGDPVVCANVAFGDTATCSIATGAGNLLEIHTATNDTVGLVTVDCTHNTDATLELFNEATNQRAQSYRYRLNPDAGTNNVVCTWSAPSPGANRYYAVVSIYSGADVAGTPFNCTNAATCANTQVSGTSIQTDAISTTTAGGLFSTFLVTREAGSVDLIVATGAGHSIVNPPNTTSGSGIQWSLGVEAGSTSTVTPGFSWAGSEQNSISGIPINAAGAGAAAPKALMTQGVGHAR